MCTKRWVTLAIVSFLLVCLGLSPVSIGAKTTTREFEKPQMGFLGGRFDDLAIGVPYDKFPPPYDDKGAVHVLFGSMFGLTYYNSQYFDESRGNVNTPEKNDAFGYSLAAGDFDGDGYVDLAVGIPGKDVNSIQASGMVQVFYGTPTGLHYLGVQIWSQTGGIVGVAEIGDQFGAALAAGDIDGDGYDDLAVGVPDEDDEVHNAENAGIVQVIFGSPTGLTANGDQMRYQGTLGVPDDPEANDHFGFSLTIGDFNGDGYEDLAVGSPDESVGRVLRAGVVHVFKGYPGGLSIPGVQMFSQDSPDVVGTVHEEDLFGYALTNGDFNGDGFNDLAVGAHWDHHSTSDLYGSATILYGSSTGLPDGSFSEVIWGDEREVRAGLGSSLAAGDFNGDRYDDLAAGGPLAWGVSGWQSAVLRSGYVYVSYGSKYGFFAPFPPLGAEALSIPYPESFCLDTCPGGDSRTQYDEFGTSLAAGDFSGDWVDELAIGVPNYDLGQWHENDYGGVLILRGSTSSGVDCGGEWLVTQDSEGIPGELGPNEFFGYALASTRQDKEFIYLPLIRR